ncbi:sulfatase-like hydrolase/transferase [Helicobacter marmotae]|uniref:sulfatase-like hydrolase/transferase n=1 Tax=Helicobacter marmotae TaxID=152490 RepID=UPI001FD43132|nr:sulfatase-like hydrolase/transferase [Helicobacter marmotae]
MITFGKIFPNPFYDPRFFHTFLAVFLLNAIVLFCSHYALLHTHFDLYFWLSFFYRILMFFVTYIALFSLIYWLRMRFVQNVLLSLILFVTLVCYVVEVFVLYHFDTPLNTYFIVTALESNPQESIEFLSTYFNFTLCGIYCFTLFAIFGIYKLHSPKHLEKLKWLYLLGFLAILLIHIERWRPSSPMLRYSDMPYNALTETQKAIKKTQAFIQEYKMLNAKFDSLSSTLQVKKATNNIDNIVLVIGESTQRNKLSLYGYPIETTPLLNKLKNTKPNNLLIFTDIISPHAQTHESLSLSLTLANQDSQGIATLPHTQKHNSSFWYEHLNIIDAFKLGGYETLSISNQEPISLFGNAAASILKRADKVEFVNNGDHFDIAKHDGSLLPILTSYLSPPPAAKSIHHFTPYGGSYTI